LKVIGFKVDKIEYTKRITPEQLNRYCLMPNEILPVCYKV
jgi:hypothetical protein